MDIMNLLCYQKITLPKEVHIMSKININPFFRFSQVKIVNQRNMGTVHVNFGVTGSDHEM